MHFNEEASYFLALVTHSTSILCAEVALNLGVSHLDFAELHSFFANLIFATLHYYLLIICLVILFVFASEYS